MFYCPSEAIIELRSPEWTSIVLVHGPTIIYTESNRELDGSTPVGGSFDRENLSSYLDELRDSGFQPVYAKGFQPLYAAGSPEVDRYGSNWAALHAEIAAS
jgi:hypothetical protein